MLLYIVRHGDPIYSTDSLTERGKEQAEAVGKRIASSKIDKIYSSPMGRARMTAEPAARLLGLDVNIEPWAYEIGDERVTSYPDGVKKSITYVQSSAFRENGDIDLGYEDTYKCHVLSDTTLKDGVDRVVNGGREFLERLGYKEENGIYKIIKPSEARIALFCHAALTKAWLSQLLHVPVHLWWSSVNINHTGVTVLEFKNYENGYTSPKMLCFSDMGHLYKEGLDMIHDNDVEL